MASIYQTHHEALSQQTKISWLLLAETGIDETITACIQLHLTQPKII